MTFAINKYLMTIQIVKLCLIFCRGRSFACGVAAAISYVFGFIATKTFLILEESLSLAGVFFVYTGFNIVATVYLYFYLPETEGLSMEDIEESYRKKTTN